MNRIHNKKVSYQTIVRLTIMEILSKIRNKKEDKGKKPLSIIHGEEIPRKTSKLQRIKTLRSNKIKSLKRTFSKI